MTPTAKKFVLQWGELGAKWGVNRTVAQIHALLYISPRPMSAADIGQALGVAQSNVSTSLRELQGWRLIRTVPVMGERREHYESLKDIWEMFRIVLDERKRREVDPALEMLKECLSELGKDEAHVGDRLTAMKEFFEDASAWYAEVRSIPTACLRKLMRLGAKVQRFIGGFGG